MIYTRNLIKYMRQLKRLKWMKILYSTVILLTVGDVIQIDVDYSNISNIQ
jgi:hypothetical protein